MKLRFGLGRRIICVLLVIFAAWCYFQTGPPGPSGRLTETSSSNVHKTAPLHEGACPRTCARRTTPTATIPDPRARAVQLHQFQTRPSPQHNAFMPQLSTQEKLSLLHVLDVLVEVLEDLQVDYFLDRGSLLGVIRHRGMIPWDDDVDVSVSVRHWKRLKAALCCVDGMSVVLQGGHKHWKLFHNDSSRVTGQPEVRFPYVDIFLYHEDDTHIWSWGIRDIERYSRSKKSNVFPLTSASFEGKEYRVPGLYNKHILSVDFGNWFSCKSPHRLHRINHVLTPSEVSTVPCSELSYMYTFY